MNITHVGILPGSKDVTHGPIARRSCRDFLWLSYPAGATFCPMCRQYVMPEELTVDPLFVAQLAVGIARLLRDGHGYEYRKPSPGINQPPRPEPLPGSDDGEVSRYDYEQNFLEDE